MISGLLGRGIENCTEHHASVNTKVSVQLQLEKLKNYVDEDYLLNQEKKMILGYETTQVKN